MTYAMLRAKSVEAAADAAIEKWEESLGKRGANYEVPEDSFKALKRLRIISKLASASEEENMAVSVDDYDLICFLYRSNGHK